ncbi:hypothetical protein GCM10010276_21110 [Streptomyces longisporus]|uniref:Uncharacterized protein n=1 Tax=Streptomyces longisporus TaxID=1948 RepID=A0ABP5YU73_STRLO
MWHDDRQVRLSQARRAERLALLERFVEVGAEAERAAFSRPAERDESHEACVAPWRTIGRRSSTQLVRSRVSARPTSEIDAHYEVTGASATFSRSYLPLTAQ